MASQRTFENSVINERVALTFSLCLIILITIGAFYSPIPAALIVSWILVVFLGNFALWIVSFRSDPANASVRIINEELSAAGRRIDIARTDFFDGNRKTIPVRAPLVRTEFRFTGLGRRPGC